MREPEQAGGTFRYADTHEAGVYLVRLGRPQPAQAVRRSPSTSTRPSRIPPRSHRQELQARFGKRPLLFCENPAELADTIRRLREGTSLWEWFLAAVLIGLVLEVFLANRGAAAAMTAQPSPAAVRLTAAVDSARHGFRTARRRAARLPPGSGTDRGRGACGGLKTGMGAADHRSVICTGSEPDYEPPRQAGAAGTAQRARTNPAIIQPVQVAAGPEPPDVRDRAPRPTPDLQETCPMAAAADRHLLFGLLALQNGLINQGQLVAAFQAWTRDKSTQPGRPPGSPRRPDRRQAGAARGAGRRFTWKRTAATWRRAWPPSPPTDPPAPAWPSWASPRSRPRSPGSPGARTATATEADDDRPRPHRQLCRSARPPATASGSASCGLTRGAGWARCSWRSTASCTARWR